MNESEEIQQIKKPTAVYVFGITNIIFGLYGLIRVLPLIYKMMIYIIKVRVNPETILGPGALVIILSVVSMGLVIWLIALGIGLLKMKKWARRGCLFYAGIQIVLMITFLSLLLPFPAIFFLPPPKDICVFFNTQDVLDFAFFITSVNEVSENLELQINAALEMGLPGDTGRVFDFMEEICSLLKSAIDAFLFKNTKEAIRVLEKHAEMQKKKREIENEQDKIATQSDSYALQVILDSSEKISDSSKNISLTALRRAI